MKSKSMVMVVVAIFAVVAVGAAIYYEVLGEGDSGAEYEVDFLFERDTGEKIWAHGSGDVPEAALKSACKKIGYSLEYAGSGETLWIEGIDGTGWVAYSPDDETRSGRDWVHFEWNAQDKAWVKTGYGFGKLPTNVKYFCFFLTDLDKMYEPMRSPAEVPS